MFTMLFTVGAGYFLYVNQANTVYTKALLARAGGISSQAEEALSLTADLTAGGDISVYANNTGGIGVNITSLYLLGSSGATLKCMGVGLPSSCTNGTPFPIWVNVGGGSGVIDTGYVPISGDVYTLKVVTQRGTVFSATYPTAATSLAARALSSGAIGDLYLQFGSYAYYNLTSGCGSSSGWCMTTSTGEPAFSIPSTVATSNAMAFSVVVTDLNPDQLNITLDQFSVLQQMMLHGTTQKLVTWYLASNSSTDINNYYTPIVLTYNKPAFLLFAASGPVCIQGQSSPTCTTFSLSGVGVLACNSNQGPCPGITAPVFLVSHGCLGIELATCSYSNGNYGQNSPYVTTLYT